MTTENVNTLVQKNFIGWMKTSRNMHPNILLKDWQSWHIGWLFDASLSLLSNKSVFSNKILTFFNTSNWGYYVKPASSPSWSQWLIKYLWFFLTYLCIIYINKYIKKKDKWRWNRMTYGVVGPMLGVFYN